MSLHAEQAGTPFPIGVRDEFAHQLRGIAALLVLITHFFGVYFGEQAVVAQATRSPNLHLTAASWVSYLDFPILKGPFGVALFFLISGFVIPISLTRKSPRGFLLARALRIYPTYWCCLCAGIAALWISAIYWEQPFNLGWGQTVANAFLVHNLTGQVSIDMVNWTLAVEIKFYLLAAACAPWLVSGSKLFLIAVPALTAVLNAALPLLARTLPELPAQAALSALLIDMNYVSYMLLGTLFYMVLQGQLSCKAMAALALWIGVCFSAGWLLGPQSGSFTAIARYYGYALVVFALCYAGRHQFRPVRVLDGLADISYPLYALHNLVGLVMIKILMDQGYAFGVAVSVATVSALALAWVIHVSVEAPTTRAGKRLAEWLDGAKRLRADPAPKHWHGGGAGRPHGRH